MIKVLNSNSKGNCYIIESKGEKLILESGINYGRIKKGLNYDLRGIVGVLISHSHQDHSRSVNEILRDGIDVYMLDETRIELGLNKTFNLHSIKPKNKIKLGDYVIIPFDGVHTHTNGDVCPIANFLIANKEFGKILFVTDSYYCRYRFKADTIMIECNYSNDIIPDLNNYELRLLKSHMSLENCKNTLSNFDLSCTSQIILIHLSPRHSNPKTFKKEIEELTGIKTYIAEPGLII